jgi:hypothetical protein
MEEKDTKSKKDDIKVYEGATFRIKHPESVTTALDQGPDYAVHYFRIAKSKVMLGVYEGMHHRLFSKDHKDLTPMRRGTTIRTGIEQGDDTWGVDSNMLVWRESVWSCVRTVISDQGKTIKLPTTIHIWYFGATEEEQMLFDSLIETLQMK